MSYYRRGDDYYELYGEPTAEETRLQRQLDFANEMMERVMARLYGKRALEATDVTLLQDELSDVCEYLDIDPTKYKAEEFALKN